MEFRIADAFTSSLAKLTGDEQKAVKSTAFDLQLNPASPGIRFHKLDRAKDKHFWSVSVNMDIRLIVHKSEGALLLCYVDHHDKAYQWAERRKLEVHPKTGAAQLVEIRETVQEIFVPVYVQENVPDKSLNKTLFDKISDDELLRYGVPQEWLADVKAATEITLLALIDHLPSESAEALLELAIGGKPNISQSIPANVDPFSHPDAQRRFRTLRDVEELELALDFPWDKWAIFLHPAQRQLVEKQYTGPARVSGSAGTGKTIVALHRAVHLAKSNENGRVLLTTFSPILSNALKFKLKRLIANEPSLIERIDVYPINEIGIKLYSANIRKPSLASQDYLDSLVATCAQEVGEHKFSNRFILSEWQQVVDTWQLKTWDDYRDVKRLGRKTRLPENQQAVLWAIFKKVNNQLDQEKLSTYSSIFTELAELFSTKPHPYTHIVIDEAQDITVAQLRFVATIGKDNPNSVFLAGDSGQRIFQQPFSWKSIGVDIRGRAKTLNVNYRTSHQIRQQSDRLLGPEVSDVDGNVEDRSKTISIFNGPQPEILTFNNPAEEERYVFEWLVKQLMNNVAAHEIGVFVRSEHEVQRAINSVKELGVPYKVLDQQVETTSGAVAISTMHLAKGLEFKSVVVMACDDEIIPSQDRIENVTDNSDLEEVYNTERHLLYVACTRARDFLLITGTDPVSEFVEDLL